MQFLQQARQQKGNITQQLGMVLSFKHFSLNSTGPESDGLQDGIPELQSFLVCFERRFNDFSVIGFSCCCQFQRHEWELNGVGAALTLP